MKDISIDVIIPTYNGMPYLKEAIASVLSQTHRQLTLYIVDDGSTDGGATKKYVKSIKDERVVYLHKKNGGQDSARNIGAQKSTAPFVAFLDSDDVWYETKLEEQLAVIGASSDVGMIYGLCDYIDEHGRKVGELGFNRSGKLFNYLLRANKITGSASMVLIRRDVMKRLGYFREDLLVAEDWALWMEIAQVSIILCVNKKLAALRVRSDSMQTDYQKMAKGLYYMYPVMLKSLHLSFRQKTIFAAACLGDATYFYVLSGNKTAARKCFRAMLFASPLSFLLLSPRRYSVYVRVLKS